MTGQKRRIALCLQYDGSAFHGWQRQTHRPSVQQSLEEAVAALDSRRPVQVVAAGRTDAGVHAAGQVVHFDAAGPIPASRWARALNGRLPATIRVRAAAAVPDDWHACFTATYRRYRYTIHNARTPNLFLAPWSWHRYRTRLDEAAMAEALGHLRGEHDFSAFQRAGSARSHARTTVQEVLLERRGDLLTVELQASGFLYGMVRLVVGQLVAVGEGRLPAETFVRRFAERDRAQVKEAAPPHGLCLLRVGYPRPVFPEAAWYDCQPRFDLRSSDPPPGVPEFPPGTPGTGGARHPSCPRIPPEPKTGRTAIPGSTPPPPPPHR
ncbi:MAG: tRNA pseudouridine(38-40) synthase TruA [Synechococcaceae cyanobacterium]|nr:tRNA pseudouridine(38-40) synthase TruA [Synechococcaceae cyanobacterium]